METESDIKKGATNLTPHSLKNYEIMAKLFLYPENEEYKKNVREVYETLQKNYPEAAEALERFVAFTEASSIVEIQELFLRSFDIQAITTLDIGFILFGEDYKRGKLLVHLNEEHQKAGNNCDTELSDHLPNLLRLLPKIQDADLRNEIVALLILPAVVKMIAEFSPEKIEKKDEVYKKHQKIILDYSTNNRTIYQSCLAALFLALKADFGYDPEPDKKESNMQEMTDPNNPAGFKENPVKDFSQNIESEMLTEK
ncbi:MAG: hypothetical protein LC128_04035 [Chitinophagales bacterium]|nr:hypothetical protein [Chitinophagales bacterium]